MTAVIGLYEIPCNHNDVIKCKHFQRCWSFVRGKHRSQRWILLTKSSDAELWCLFDLHLNKRWANNRDAGDLRRHHGHHDVSVMTSDMIYKHSNPGVITFSDMKLSIWCAILPAHFLLFLNCAINFRVPSFNFLISFFQTAHANTFVW